MISTKYLLDTCTLLFWSEGEENVEISAKLLQFLHDQNEAENLLISSASFWEIAYLVKKGKYEPITDVKSWKDELLRKTNLVLIHPTENEMIDSVILPDIHKDPFDRLLISQANYHKSKLITNDSIIKKYDVDVFWI